MNGTRQFAREKKRLDGKIWLSKERTLYGPTIYVDIYIWFILTCVLRAHVKEFKKSHFTLENMIF